MTRSHRAVAQGAHVLGLVGRQQHGRPAGLLGQQAAKGGPLLRVQAGGRLVENDQPRVTHERLREREAAPLAGERRDPFAGLLTEVNQVKHAPDFRAPGRGVLPFLEDGDVVEEAGRGHPRRHTDLPGQVAERAAGVGALGEVAGNVMSRNGNRAGGRQHSGGE